VNNKNHDFANASCINNYDFTDVNISFYRRKQLIEICNNCKVIKNCLSKTYNIAKQNSEIVGIWGGIYISTTHKRQTILKKIKTKFFFIE